MRSERWDISRLTAWEKNPRSIGKKEFAKLVEQIKELRQYKPLLVTPEGVVLGGNMRLQAYKELGLKEVWVSVVEPKNEKEMLEYALSDNDVVGEYDSAQVEDLLESTGFDIDGFTLSSGASLPLDQFSTEESLVAMPENEVPDSVDTIHKYTFSFPDEQFRDTLRRILAIVDEKGLNDTTEVFFLLKETYEKSN